MSEYAYVFLVMRGVSYVPGALVAGASVKAVTKIADVVCMVTDDAESGREDLEKIFDKVININYLTHETRKLNTDKQEKYYSTWKADAYTKWRCLGLNYKKVLFMDCDIIVLSNMDDLFSLNAPAATFTNPWMPPKNPYGKLQHGSLVSKKAIDEALRRRFSVCIGHCVLLPAAQTNDALMEKFEEYLDGFEVFGFGSNSMVDEESICDFFNGRETWTHISQEYGFIPWHFKWLWPGQIPKCFHYFGQKPWAINTWPDMQCWWQVADFVMARHPEVKWRFELKSIILNNCFWCEHFGCDPKHTIFTVDPDKYKLTCPLLLGQPCKH